MHRLVKFTSLAGTLVGAAIGGIFTPFGIPFGAFAGAVLGLLSGCWTAAGIEHDEPHLSLSAARVRLTTPPLVLLAVAVTITGLVLGSAVWPVVIYVLAAPLSAAVTLTAAPWVVTLVRPRPEVPLARRDRTRAILIPVWFLLITVVAWVAYFLLLMMQ